MWFAFVQALRCADRISGRLEGRSAGNLLVIDQAPPGNGASVLDVFPPAATKPSKVYALSGADVLDVAIDQNEDRLTRRTIITERRQGTRIRAARTS